MFITITPGGAPYYINGSRKLQRRSTKKDASFALEVCERFANTSLVNLKGKKWYASPSHQNRWYGRAECLNRTGQQTSHLHIHSVLYGPDYSRFPASRTHELLQESWTKVHVNMAGFVPDPLHIEEMNSADAYRYFLYTDKHFDSSAPTGTFIRTF